MADQGAASTASAAALAACTAPASEPSAARRPAAWVAHSPTTLRTPACVEAEQPRGGHARADGARDPAGTPAFGHRRRRRATTHSATAVPTATRVGRCSALVGESRCSASTVASMTGQPVGVGARRAECHPPGRFIAVGAPPGWAASTVEPSRHSAASNASRRSSACRRAASGGVAVTTNSTMSSVRVMRVLHSVGRGDEVGESRWRVECLDGAADRGDGPVPSTGSMRASTLASSSASVSGRARLPLACATCTSTSSPPASRTVIVTASRSQSGGRGW